MNHQLVNIKELVKNSLEGVIVPQSVKVSVSDNTTNPEALLAREMMQVITNLVKNAIDAMPAGGLINISLEDTLSDVVIVISDSGTGIKEEDRAKIFEPFYHKEHRSRYGAWIGYCLRNC